MKPITFEGREMLYNIFSWSDEDGWKHYETTFYEAKESYKTMRKYLFFGPKIKYPYNKKLFILQCNIEDPGYSKEDVRKKISTPFNRMLRREEIAKGELI